MSKRSYFTLNDLEKYVAKQKAGYEQYYGQLSGKKKKIVPEKEEEEIFNVPDDREKKEKELIEKVERIKNDRDMSAPEKERLIIKLIGPPPYSNEDSEKYKLPLGFVTRKKVNIQENEYKFENPHPNYYKFKVQLIDTFKREYAFPTESELHEYSLSERESDQNILFAKLPIKVKREGVFIPKIGEKLTLFERDLKYQLICSVTAVFFKPLRSTGYIKVKVLKELTGADIDQSLFRSINT